MAQEVKSGDHFMQGQYEGMAWSSRLISEVTIV